MHIWVNSELLLDSWEKRFPIVSMCQNWNTLHIICLQLNLPCWMFWFTQLKFIQLKTCWGIFICNSCPVCRILFNGKIFVSNSIRLFRQSHSSVWKQDISPEREVEERVELWERARQKRETILKLFNPKNFPQGCG